LLGAFEFRNFEKRYDGGPKETELLERRRGYDAFLGEKTTTVVSVKMRRLNWNIRIEVEVKKDFQDRLDGIYTRLLMRAQNI